MSLKKASIVFFGLVAILTQNGYEPYTPNFVFFITLNPRVEWYKSL